MSGDLRRASKAALDLFRWAERIVITTHVQPDGDGIGSEVALAHWLRDQGKVVDILNPHSAPRRFRFLEVDIPAPGFDPTSAERLLGAADLLAVLDISVPARAAAKSSSSITTLARPASAASTCGTRPRPRRASSCTRSWANGAPR